MSKATTLPNMTTSDFQHFQSYYKPLINDKLLSYFGSNLLDNRLRLQDAIHYSLSAQGKRIRPLLCIASCQLFRDAIDCIMPIACAIELVHTYSLIHDDLPAMDNDDYRRGQLTCHKKFGEGLAILSGDTLNSFAFELIANELPQFYSDSKVVLAIQALSHSFGLKGMAGGQALDLYPDCNPELNKRYENLKKIHALKTGIVIETAITLPAKLETTDPAILQPLAKFGAHLGLLFQIIDDILDVTGTKEILGKSPLKDLEQDKLTYTSLFGLTKARKLAQQEAKEAEAALNDLSRHKDCSLFYSILHYLLERTY